LKPLGASVSFEVDLDISLIFGAKIYRKRGKIPVFTTH
jgi:hypothetical protein